MDEDDTPELEHDLELSLLAFAPGFHLFSPVTGELKHLDEPRPHELVPDDAGVGALVVVSGIEKKKTPASSLMQLRLRGRADGALFVVAPGRPRQSLTDLRLQYTTLAISISVGGDVPDLQRFDCETYHFASSNVGWTVFWVFGFVTDAIGLTEARHLRYTTLTAPWKAKVAELIGFVDATGTSDADHFRISHRAAWAKSPATTELEDDAALQCSRTREPDHSMSSFALLIVLAMYSCKQVHRRRETQVTPEAIQLRAKCVFLQVVRAFVKGDAEFSYAYDEETEVLFRVSRRLRDGCWGCALLRASGIVFPMAQPPLDHEPSEALGLQRLLGLFVAKVVICCSVRNLADSKPAVGAELGCVCLLPPSPFVDIVALCSRRALRTPRRRFTDLRLEVGCLMRRALPLAPKKALA